MRTKALLGLAVLAAGAMTAAAQSSVYSLNVVGYYNKTVPAGQYALIANQLVTTNYTVPVLFANVPDGSSVLKWSGAGFLRNDLDGEWLDPDMTLGPGEAAFFKNNSANPVTLTFVGEVNQATNVMNFTAGVYKLASLFTPQAGGLASQFGFQGGDGDSILRWAGTGYLTYLYDGEWEVEPTVEVGEGFFIKTATTKTWTRSFTVPQ